LRRRCRYSSATRKRQRKTAVSGSGHGSNLAELRSNHAPDLRLALAAIDDRILDNLGTDPDPHSGKSVNAIRFRPGIGTTVWGARTLAGNDNQWRYVNVSRLGIFLQESIRRALEQFVFESNDSSTWSRIRSMIEDFLAILWRQGALAGDRTTHAFLVQAGPGTTMTADDVLQGRVICMIGFAPLRPAEFILLHFTLRLHQPP